MLPGMADVIQFPAERTLRALPKTNAEVCPYVQALRLLLSSIRKGARPQKMFIVFEADTATFFLNLGFAPDELVKRIDEVLQAAEQNPGDWDY
jgi:hypothetical protein